jgi:hypothetical protein
MATLSPRIRILICWQRRFAFRRHDAKMFLLMLRCGPIAPLACSVYEPEERGERTDTQGDADTDAGFSTGA